MNISTVHREQAKPLSRKNRTTSGIPVLLRSERQQIKNRNALQLVSNCKKITPRNECKGLVTKSVEETAEQSPRIQTRTQTSDDHSDNNRVTSQQFITKQSFSSGPPGMTQQPRRSSGQRVTRIDWTRRSSTMDNCECCCCCDNGVSDECTSTGNRFVNPSFRLDGGLNRRRFQTNSRNATSSQLYRKLRKSTLSDKCSSGGMSCQKSLFWRLLQRSPPSVPPALIKGLDRREPSAIGRVKVMLRFSPSTFDLDRSSLDETAAAAASFMELDARKKQVTIYEPRNSSLGPAEERSLGIAAPKMFAFDNIFSSDDSQSEVCSRTLSDILPGVVNGSDGCLFTYGYSKLGKTRTMVGSCDSVHDLGLMPCATSWLFKLIAEHKQKSGARFSVRVSATEIAGKNEVVRDLLASQANGTEIGGFSPGNYLLDESSGFGNLLQNQCELRTPNAEKAAYYLDAALAARSTEFPDSDGISHFLFTFHIYQYQVDKSGQGGMGGGRSRLYLLDLGGCEKQSQVYSNSKSYRISMANLGNVILAIFNGRKHVPYKEGKLTQMLREILGNVTCRASMLAHVSPSPDHYTESLATIQLASRIHRLRHNKWKHLYMGGAGEDDSFGQNSQRGRNACNGLRSSSSDFDYTSSDTCDTVIFVGPSRETSRTTIHEEQMIIEKPADHQTVAVAENQRTSFAQIRRMQGSGLFNNNNLMKVVSSSPSASSHNHNNLENGVVEFKVNNRVNVARQSTLVPSSSDEFWVDGPKINRQKVQNLRRNNTSLKTLTSTATGPETWVDGPLGIKYLDDHKRVMIENWIGMSDAFDNVDEEINGNHGSRNVDNTSAVVFARAVDGVVSKTLDPTDVMFNEVDVVSTVDSVVSGDDTEKSTSGDVITNYQCEGHDRSFNRDGISLDDMSLEAHDDDDDDDESEHHRWGVDVISLIPAIENAEECVRQLDCQTSDFILEFDEIESEFDVDGAGETVYMTDSWVQVSESDLLETRPSPSRVRRYRSIKNADEYEDHPLRVLSSESLAISFTTNSSRMSWDSGLNAVRKAMAAANIMDDDAPFDFGPYATITANEFLEADWLDSRSICSEPCTTSTSSIAMSMDRLRKLNAYKSGSLRNLSHLSELLSSRSRSFTTSNYSCCSCHDCHIKWLRRPDGASDPHLDCHSSSNDKQQEKFCFWKPKDDSIFTRTFESQQQMNKEVSPIECKEGLIKRTIGCGSNSTNADSSSVHHVDNSDSAIHLCNFDVRNVNVPNLPEPSISIMENSWSDENSLMCPALGEVVDEDCIEIRQGDEDDKEQPSSTATSSGYNSMPRDCEEDSGGSVSAVDDSTSLNSEEICQSPSHADRQSSNENYGSMTKHGLGSFKLCVYDEEDVARMERRRNFEKELELRKRCSRIRFLRKKQHELRRELESTKRLLMIDETNWNSDFYVEQNMDEDDPDFLDALENETLILDKRLSAYKSHLMLVTCFDVIQHSCQMENENF